MSVYLMERVGMNDCYAASRVLCFLPQIRVFVVRVKVRSPMPNGQSLLSENVGHFVIKQFSPFMSLFQQFFSFFEARYHFHFEAELKLDAKYPFQLTL
jgi:hypothetical protein